jgi:hypothetical protein
MPASSDAARMPTLAASWSSGRWKAMPVVNSGTVNPIPAMAAIPTR